MFNHVSYLGAGSNSQVSNGLLQFIKDVKKVLSMVYFGMRSDANTQMVHF